MVRIVWLFSLVLGHSRWLWGRFCAAQDLQTVMRCHIDAFDAMGGAPCELLYDPMKTAVVGEDAEGVVTYNASLVALLNHGSVHGGGGVSGGVRGGHRGARLRWSLPTSP